MLIKEANSYEESVNYISNSTKVFFFSPWLLWLAFILSLPALRLRRGEENVKREKLVSCMWKNLLCFVLLAASSCEVTVTRKLSHLSF